MSSSQSTDFERQPLLNSNPTPSYDSNSPKTVKPGDLAATEPGDLGSVSNVLEDVRDVGTAEAESRKRKISIAWKILAWVVGSVLVVLLIIYTVKAAKKSDVKFDFKAALKKALGGGLSGAAAMVIQVLTLMPLRTVMNYQYRFGHSTTQAIKVLYADGGIPRYYSGLWAALFQGPIARFGDTFANVGILALLKGNEFLNSLPAGVKTIFSSTAAALFRMVLMPVDTLKTTLQAHGPSGTKLLKDRVKAYGIGSLWYGAIATALATFVGNYPWFAVFNSLEEILPPPHSTFTKYAREAFKGFAASVVSDTVSNSIRVVKTYRQVNDTKVSYMKAASEVIEKDGLWGLFFRGLGTRLIANGLQGLLFSILWKLFLDMWEEKTKTDFA